ncbi:hypothetical protein [Streptosporangium sp. NPDC000396]|uniref:hypothetical protein n=1 Tax=Streptosporangium sp. NPDC000396 TaxID=3366185 RepID=UPI00369F1B12
MGVFWLVGTLLLALLTFENGFALAGTEPNNAQLAAVFAVATVTVGVGVPVIGLLVSLVTRRWVAAVLFATPLMALLFVAIRMELLPIDRIFPATTPSQPEICTAPPDKAVGVPGC